MTKVFAADKSSYGGELMVVYASLDELKRGIVAHEFRHSKEPIVYTEELFKEASDEYELYEVDLHDDEYIHWHEYDGSCWFSIEKRDKNIFSTKERVG